MDLVDRFDNLLQSLDVEEQAGGLGTFLLECHSSSGRCYHDLSHVRFCLSQLDAAGPGPAEPQSVELALWFQDVVRDPGADDNELRSALMFDARLGVHLPTRMADDVHHMIMATAHAGGPEQGDAALVADIDLSRLAQPWDEFSEVVELLRRESGGRNAVAFLETLSARPDIYLTGHFHERCEDEARRNIEQYLNTSS